MAWIAAKYVKEQFSLGIWFRTTETQKDKRLFNLNYDGGKSGLLFTALEGKVALGFRDDKGEYYRLEHEVSYNDNNWHFLLATYNGKEFSLYMNGELVNMAESTFAGFGTKATDFGSYQGKSNFFTGELDEASLWSSSLKLEDAKRLYNEGIPTKLHRDDLSEQLIKWWRMGDSAPKAFRGKVN